MVATVSAIVRSGDPALARHLDPLLATVEEMNPVTVGMRFQPLVTMVSASHVEWSPAMTASFRNTLRSDRPDFLLIPLVTVVDALRVPDLEVVLTELIETSRSGPVQVAAARALGNVSSASACDNLSRLASGSTAPMRVVGAGLERLRGCDVSALLALSAHHDPYIRIGVATALGPSTDPRATKRLRELVHDPSSAVRAAVIGALHDHEDELLDVFATTMSDPDPDVRKAAVDAIRFDPTKERLACVGLVANDTAHSARLSAVKVLSEFGTNVRRTLEPLTGTLDRKVRRAAARGLRELSASESQAARRSGRRDRYTLRTSLTLRYRDLRRLALDERLTGANSAEVMQKVQTKILLDDELRRRFHVWYVVGTYAVLVALFLMMVIAIAAGRLGVGVCRWLLDHVLIALVLLAVMIVGWFVAKHRRPGRIHGMALFGRGPGVACFGLAVYGLVFYLWWVPISILAAVSGCVAAWYMARSRRKRIVRVDQPSDCENTDLTVAGADGEASAPTLTASGEDALTAIPKPAAGEPSSG